MLILDCILEPNGVLIKAQYYFHNKKMPKKGF